MAECEICGAEGSRLQVNHKDQGRLMVCRDCWKEINEEGLSVCERTGTGSAGSAGSAGSCPTCGI